MESVHCKVRPLGNGLSKKASGIVQTTITPKIQNRSL